MSLFRISFNFITNFKTLSFRFDNLFIMNMLLEMNFSDMRTLHVGSGLHEIHLPSLNSKFFQRW